MSYYKQSRKKRIAAAVIVVVLVGCMLATTLIASFILRAGLDLIAQIPGKNAGDIRGYAP